jgi:two-component system sensor histidine kinase QseC
MASLPNPEPVNWRTLARTVTDDSQDLADKRKITLTFEDSDKVLPLPAQGNPLLLALLLRNLIDNALRYAGAGAQVWVSLNDQGLEVRDNGPGVTACHLEHIGERFFRPPGQNESGSGLGLSIVRRIAVLHGLALTLENRSEGGFRAALRAETSATLENKQPPGK